ncbi:MAG: hypothetical protein A2355_08900 [Spirochaetes bacterium RIFOXYB1_FULL_32_8]|nr:MAG: hypothetical protein A2355_08900 [Spirochaetes bacterium RIFOXYB1_FULL_32_8]HBI36020.1 hypothetical protein [Spirochaetia bacterium]
MQAIINVSDSIIMALNENKDDFLMKMKLFTAVEYFKEEKLSLGKAAELADMNKIDFMFYLGKNNIPVINYSLEDLEKELGVMNNL